MPRPDTAIYNVLRRMGRDDLAKRFVGGSYEDSVWVEDYRVDFREDGDEEITFLIRNPETPCLVMYIYKDEAILESLDYSHDCNRNGMDRGEGTRKMIRFALELAKSLGAKVVQLQDESTFQYDGMKIKLGPFLFLRTGQTWYEKHFGFYPTPEFQEEYERAKEKLPEFSFLRDKPVTYFDRQTIDKHLRDIELSFYRIVWEKRL